MGQNRTDLIKKFNIKADVMGDMNETVSSADPTTPAEWKAWKLEHSVLLGYMKRDSIETSDGGLSFPDMTNGLRSWGGSMNELDMAADEIVQHYIDSGITVEVGVIQVVGISTGSHKGIVKNNVDNTVRTSPIRFPAGCSKQSLYSFQVLIRREAPA